MRYQSLYKDLRHMPEIQAKATRTSWLASADPDPDSAI